MNISFFFFFFFFFFWFHMFLYVEPGEQWCQECSTLSPMEYLRYLDVAYTHSTRKSVCSFSAVLPLASRYTVHKLKLHSNPVGCCGYRTRWNAHRRRGRRRKLHSPPVTVGRGMMSI
jgi:hypothetical protein